MNKLIKDEEEKKHILGHADLSHSWKQCAHTQLAGLRTDLGAQGPSFLGVRGPRHGHPCAHFGRKWRQELRCLLCPTLPGTEAADEIQALVKGKEQAPLAMLWSILGIHKLCFTSGCLRSPQEHPLPRASPPQHQAPRALLPFQWAGQLTNRSSFPHHYVALQK